MPQPERQHYVAYGSASDEFDVYFFGGPLDGAYMRTDILPECGSFVHRLRDKTYSYRYERISSFRFHATLDRGAPVLTHPMPRHRSAKWAIVAGLVLAIMAAVMGVWRLSQL
ncbi:MAG: hypothetical protein AAF961_00055 [Planctomycetota bacterium]